MVEEQVTNTQEASPSVSNIQTGTQTVQSSEDVFSGKSSADIEALLGKMTQGGEQGIAQKQGVQDKPVSGQLEKPNDQELQVPDKFKNPDGTLKVESLLKSYTDAEKTLSRYGNVNHENETLKQQMTQMQQLVEDLRSAYLEKSQTKTKEEGSVEYTPEEIEEIQKNPKAFIAREVQRVIADRDNKNTEVQREQRIRDYELLSAVNKARETLPEFSKLEPEIQKLADKEFITPHPEMIPILYNSVLGQKLPSIVDYVKQSSFKEGYDKAKQEMKLQVEGGGKDTSPVDISLDNSNIDKLSASELEKILPKAGDSTTRVVY